MTLGLRNDHIALGAALLLGACAMGCGTPDPDGSDDGSSSGAATSAGSHELATDGPGASGQQQDSSGWDPCGTAGCGPWEDDGSSWTSGATSGLPTTSDSNGDAGPGPLITTGNEDATEWDVTVQHTVDGGEPMQGTYLTTTIIYMETEFHGVVEIPTMGGAWYAYVDGDHADGVVTIVDGSGESANITIAGTLQITDLTLGGSGTWSDASTGEPLGAWEILDATPHG